MLLLTNTLCCHFTVQLALAAVDQQKPIPFPSIQQSTWCAVCRPELIRGIRLLHRLPLDPRMQCFQFGEPPLCRFEIFQQGDQVPVAFRTAAHTITMLR